MKSIPQAGSMQQSSDLDFRLGVLATDAGHDGASLFRRKYISCFIRHSHV